jgi:hypothetical protein
VSEALAVLASGVLKRRVAVALSLLQVLVTALLLASTGSTTTEGADGITPQVHLAS